MYKCIIIDDELHAIEGLKSYVEDFSGLECIGSYQDPLVALKEITASENVDLIFVDIDMPKLSGLDLSKKIRHKTNKLVFSTAHVKYAYDAFEANADSFLLKPYTFDKFSNLVNKLLSENKEPQRNPKNSERSYFYIKAKDDQQKIIKILFNELIAVVCNEEDIIIYIPNGSIVTSATLADIYKQVDDKSEFHRFQNLFIVNEKYIESVNPLNIKMINGLNLNVDEILNKDFSEFIKLKNINKRKIL